MTGLAGLLKKRNDFRPLLIAGGGLLLLHSMGLAQNRAATAYNVVAVEDVSTARAVRLKITVRVKRALSEQEIRAVAKEIISTQRPHNAAAIFFYLPDSDTSGAFTAGKAEWAPYGRWADAANVKTGDYSHHQLVVTAGGALGEVKPKDIVSNLPDAKRREIFYELVKLQDSGGDAAKAYGMIARRYKIPEDWVWKIADEGLKKSWPMPRP
jgi:hypothetical protein